MTSFEKMSSLSCCRFGSCLTNHRIYYANCVRETRTPANMLSIFNPKKDVPHPGFHWLELQSSTIISPSRLASNLHKYYTTAGALVAMFQQTAVPFISYHILNYGEAIIVSHKYPSSNTSIAKKAINCYCLGAAHKRTLQY